MARRQGGPGTSVKPSDNRRMGGWKNAKMTAHPSATQPKTVIGATAFTTPPSVSTFAADSAGGAAVIHGGPGGSLAMSGRVVVKHPRAGASHFSGAAPALKKKRPTQKAPGK